MAFVFLNNTPAWWLPSPFELVPSSRRSAIYLNRHSGMSPLGMRLLFEHYAFQYTGMDIWKQVPRCLALFQLYLWSPCPALRSNLFQGWLQCLFVCECVLVWRGSVSLSQFSILVFLLSSQRNAVSHTLAPTLPPTLPPAHTWTLTNALSQSKSHWNSDHVLYFGVVTFCYAHGPELQQGRKCTHTPPSLPRSVCLSRSDCL